MLDNFNRSLLKGIAEVPFENLGEVPAEIFDQLTPIDKFLINDSLLTYSVAPATYDFPLSVSGEEKYPFASIHTAYLFNRLRKSYIRYATSYLIRQHLHYKVLFQPDLIVHVLANKNMWDDHITSLVKVIRERGRWLSSLHTEWNWWNKSLNQDVWMDRNDGGRYLFLRILRVFKPGESAQLIKDSWTDENTDARRLILRIITETLTAEDTGLILYLFHLEKGKLRSSLRRLLFIYTNNYSQELEQLILKNNGSIFSVNKSSFVSPLLKELDPKSDGIVGESLFVKPFAEYYTTVADRNGFDNYMKEFKDPGVILNELIINYFYKKDVNSIASIVENFMSAAFNLKLNTTILNIINASDQVFNNELILYVLQNNSAESKWNLLTQLITGGSVSLDKKNTGAFILLIRKEIENIPANKSSLEELISGGCFAVHSAYLGDWKTCCEEIAFSLEDLNYQKVNARTRELTSFRSKFESYFPHGQQ